MRIILVSGPAGGGKSNLAQRLLAEKGGTVISTDEFKESEWDQVPFLVAERLREAEKFPIILEGVRALSVIHKFGLASQVIEAWWAESGGERPGCAGMTTRQRKLAHEMALQLPEWHHV